MNSRRNRSVGSAPAPCGEATYEVFAAVWDEWARFVSTLSATVPDTYEVAEVQSRLSA